MMNDWTKGPTSMFTLGWIRDTITPTVIWGKVVNFTLSIRRAVPFNVER